MNKVIFLICLFLFSGCTLIQTNKQHSISKPNLKDCAPVEKNNINSLQSENLKVQKIECHASKKKITGIEDTRKNYISNASLGSIINYPKGVFKNIALETCKEAVRVRLYSPSSLKEDISKTSVKIIDKRRATVKIPFVAKTGLGKLDSQVGYCIIDSNGKILVLNITKE